MSGRWFRFYAEALRNPKVARLSDKEFRLWVELLAVAADNDGSIPCLDDLKHLLKRRLDHLSTGVERLISIGLIDALEDGYEPHNWSKFQYKSDVSTERVHKHRAKRNVSETPPDTEADTEEEETNVSSSGARKPAQRPKADRGHRLPADWQPEALTGASAAEVAVWPVGAIERELSRFRDWAASATGPNSVKSNWQAAWRNWLKKAQDDGRYGRTPQQRNGFTGQSSTRDIGLEIAAELSGSGRPADNLPRIGPPGRLYG